MIRTLVVTWLLFALTFSLGLAATPATLVVCAPGYPGSTLEAQPSMSRLAAAVAAAAGSKPDFFSAIYFEQEAAGVTRLKQSDAALAMVPLPFFLSHERELKLMPVLQAVQKGGAANEPWSLVGKRGRAAGAAALDGYELISLASYVPRFVEKVALQGYGPLPATLEYTASPAVLSALRRVSAGENVVVLLDASQAAAVPKLPFAAEIETLKQSAPLPSVLLCTVGGRGQEAAVKRSIAALSKLHESREGSAALDGVRLTRFVPLDVAALERARTAFGLAP